MKKERIDKLIAGSGKLSRKDVAGLISHGNVTLNGRTVKAAPKRLMPMRTRLKYAVKFSQ